MSARRRTEIVLASLVVLVASTASLVATSTAATAAPGPAFTCATPTYFLSQGTQTASDPTKTQLYTSTAETGTTVYTTLGSPQPEVYNALGFDPLNQYLYSTLLGGNVLYQIDDTGTANSLGAISGYTAVPDQPADGAFDASGNYWITGGNGSTTAYEINVTSTPPKVISSLALTQSWQPIDYTLNGGFMWGLYNRTLYRLNMATGTVSTFNGPSGLEDEDSGNYGAAWTYDNGNLGFSNNANGSVYQISVTNPSSSTPSFALLDMSTGPVAGQSNDGATCEPVAPPSTDLSIAKSGPATVQPGGLVTWTLVVKNNGPNNSQGFAVDDTVPSGYTNVTANSGCMVAGTSVTCAGAALANGASTTVTLTADAPSTYGTCTTNNATVTADQMDPNSANNASSVQTCTMGKINISKSASPGSYTAAGQTIHYSYLVTNGSSSNMTGITVTDPMAGLSAISCPSTTLAAGASETCTATYTTKGSDVTIGTISNTGTANGTVNGGQVTASSSLTIPYSALTLAKTAVTTGYSASGQALTYNYLVTNAGKSTINSIAISDSKVPAASLTCPSPSLASGASEICTGTYVTTAADMTAGSVTNTATATGTDSVGNGVTSNQSHATVSARTSSLSLVKSSTTSGYSAAGQTLSYDYVVKNNGTTTINAITVSDNKVAPANLTCPGSSLAAGASETCTGTYVTTQTNVDAGSVTNTATAGGTDQYGLPITSNPSSVTVPTAGTTSSLSLTKTATVGGYSAAGQTLSYDYLVKNTGTTTISDITISDNLVAAANLTCPQPSLAPGASETCTGTYVTIQANVDAGSVTNVATAGGTNPSDTPVTSNQSTATVTANGAASSLSLVKSSTTSGYSAAGQTLSYDYLVKNTGTTTISDITISDNLIATVSCPPGPLAPGDSETCTGSYSVTQADVDAGFVTNNATAIGTDPSNEPVTSNKSTVTVTAHGTTSSLSLTKSTTTPSYSAAGQTLSYDYLVKNTGTTTISTIGVSDNRIATVSCPDSSLAPGASETCTGSYTTTQVDVDTGSVTNAATASGTNPASSPITSNPSTVTVPASGATSSLSLTKSTTTPSYSAAGQTLSYDYLVKNTGTTTISTIGVSDNRIATVSCPDSSLAPGASETCTGSYTTTQVDVDTGSVTNAATASGTNPASSPITSNPSTVTVPASGATSSLSLTKSTTTPSYSAAGQTLSYDYLVKNTGTTTISTIGVSDNRIATVSCPDSSLAPGASETCTGSYTTTQVDVDTGSVTNAATASGTNPASSPITSNPSTVTVPASGATSSLSLTKSTTTPSYSAAGQTLSYDYLVKNTGTTTISGLGVTDTLVSPANLSCPDSSLAPGASETCTGSYTTTQVDVDAGSVTNIANATGTDAHDNPVVSPGSTVTVPAVGTTSSLSLTKSSISNGYSAAGGTLSYNYLVTNTGTTTISSIAVSDNRIAAVSCPASSLAPGGSETCTGSYTTTQADVDAGQVTNTARASGTNPANSPVTSNPSTVTVPAKGTTSALSLVKSTTTSGYASAGDFVFYGYLVTNTGTTTVSSISISDNQLAPADLSCPDSSLAPGAHETCTGTYITTQADVDAGSVTNRATASGTDPHGSPVTSNPSTVTVRAAGTTSSLSLTKTAVTPSYSAAGQTLTYNYLVTNTGTTTISAIAVSDNVIATVSCPDPALAPGDSETCSGNDTTTQADVDAGSVTNTATASGTDPYNNPVTSNRSTVTVPAKGTTSSLSLTKTAVTPSYSAAGQTLTYNYLVTNTGTTTISAIAVSDNVIAKVSCPDPSLAPGDSETCSGNDTTTQADVDAGSVTNTATASGTDPQHNPVTSNPSKAIVPARGATAALSLVKSALTGGYSVPGETLSYDYLVTNTGTTTISSIAVTDDHVAPADLSCPKSSLAPTSSETCTGTYKTTQVDVDTGSVTNTATASGTDPQHNPVTSNQSIATVPASSSPSISIDKTTNGSDGLDIPLGAAVTWAYRVTNSGNVTLTDVTVTDNMVAASAINCGGSSNVLPSLAPGSTVTCTATGTTVAGSYANTGTVTGTTPTSGSVQASDNSGYYGVQDLSVTKTADPTLTRTYDWSVAKRASPPLIERVTGGTATAGFIVTATQAGHTDGRWKVSGTITVTNPNSNETITAQVSDAVDNGGTCLVAGSSSDAVPVAASGAASVAYVCTYASAPTSANGTNTATATWDRSAADTPQGSATGNATFTFGTGSVGNPDKADQCILVTDTFNGGPATTLGTDCVGVDPVTDNFAYTQPVTVPMGLTTPATLPGTTITPTTVSFAIPSAGNWGLVLTLLDGHTLAYVKGTSGTLSVRVPTSDTCQYQYDVLKNGQFYEGAKTTIPRCGGQPNCLTYPNTATLVPTGQSASASVETCGAAVTGAEGMSSWKTTLQGVITGGASTGGVCNSATWLRRFAPFQDLGATARCTAVGTYVTKVIDAATPTSMPTMLKAQMLATALNVYFSNPKLGGDKIAAPAPIDRLSVDLTKVCSMVDTAHGSTCGNPFADTATDGHNAWGGAPRLTVAALLLYAASKSNVGGTVWYGSVAAAQQDAKNTFDAINNLAAFVP